MGKFGSLLFQFFRTIFILTFSFSCKATDEDRKVYIVYIMGALPASVYRHRLITLTYCKVQFRAALLRTPLFEVIKGVSTDLLPNSLNKKEACYKIIGARYYASFTEGSGSARDDVGHGSHTASTAAGNGVKGASFYGIAEGTARGGVTSARIAAYKACGGNGCQSYAILAAFDDAIADGVDIITGSSVSSFKLDETTFPLVYGRNASSRCSELMSRMCDMGCLETRLVKGNIVLCNEAAGVDDAYRAGAVGSISASGKFNDVAYTVPVPAVVLNPQDYQVVLNYLGSTDDPRATILKSEAIKNSAAPIVASFSSRGPNAITVDILKPDITAPE